jgi:hypothetical protein
MNLNLLLASLGNTSTLIWKRIQHGILICFEENDDYGKLDINQSGSNRFLHYIFQR